MPTITSAGVGSGLDIENIISRLMQVEQAPVDAVKKQKTAINAKISAYGTLKSGIASFQTSVKNLGDVSKFNAQTTVSSDPLVATATTNNAATLGTYSLKVNQLAQQQKIGSAGISNINAALGTGSITITLGTYDSTANTFTNNPDKSAKSLTISSTSNSLAGIRDAINAGDLGVSASIVNDGTSNRLVVTSKDTGAKNSIKLTVTDADGNNTDNSGLSQLAYDPTKTTGTGKNATELQAAKSAIVELDGVTVTKQSNFISDALDGVTINLLKLQTATPINITVSRDTALIEKSVTDFVKAYNDINTTLRNLTKYDPVNSANSGPLLADSAARSIATQIRATLNKGVVTNGSTANLGQVGVTFQQDGTLALDSTKLKAAITANPDNVANVFAAVGKTSDSLITYSGQTSKTQPGTYAVNVTQLAAQGYATGAGSPNLTITQGVNDQINISINSVAYSVILPAGSYASVDSLAAALQARLTAAGAQTSTTVIPGGLPITTAGITVAGGKIQVTSASYGGTSNVSVTGGNGSTDLFGGVALSTAGQSVAGSINGVAALATGRTLKGATGNASEGLSVTVLGGATGARGTVSYTKGYAAQFNTLTEMLLDTTGLVTTRNDALNASNTRLSKQQTVLEDRLVGIEKRYRLQFTALDKTVSALQSTSTFLTQQIAQFSSNNKA